MTCTDWQTRLSAYVDAELSPREMEDFRAHAAQCPECASAALAAVEAKAALRRAGRRYDEPADLRARVMADMHRTPARPALVATSPPPTRNPHWKLWAGAAAMLFLALGLYYAAITSQRSGTLAEFADLHVANLAGTAPVEVVSSDRHTVKPWFQGRIPFTFDLPDLQGSPFALLGGRVTYFHQEPGAQLIVTYQRHMVSVFIFRDTPQLAIHDVAFSDRSTSFNLQTWTQDGLRYVLVSDVNTPTLQQLAMLLQHH
jgi:anti-sigma factor (TIGR02949 family)